MKYVIYKNKIGLRATEYADTEESIKHYPYIDAKNLPVIINSRGGYSSFHLEYEKENGFLEIIEVDDEAEPLTREQMYPKNSPDFEYGWIDRDGNTYNTGHEGHSVSAYYLCKEYGLKDYNYERVLEEAGWAKVTAHWDEGVLKKDVFISSDDNFFITKKQADTLFDLGLWEVGHVPFYIKCSENRW